MTDFEERQKLAADLDRAVAAYQEKFGITRTIAALIRLRDDQERVLQACMEPNTTVTVLFP